jgi:aminotransferase in exopolysaccharide biosynthesis
MSEMLVCRLTEFLAATYGVRESYALHEPIFIGDEMKNVGIALDSTFVSSVGAFVDEFERKIADYTGAERAVATVSGTAALHVALLIAGVQPGDLVITQPLTFVASCNAITYCGAAPVFVDVDRTTLSLSPAAMEEWLEDNARLDADGVCRARDDARRISACLPMHTFGHPADLDGLLAVCSRWNLALVEDAAEALGSRYRGRHAGTFGRTAALSFNGNKIITTGGGGMVLASQEQGRRAKHIATTAKLPHPYEFVHDEIGFNYRLPNINAALGCAQMDRLDSFVTAKRKLALSYSDFFKGNSFEFILEPEDCQSNYWLNAIICADGDQRDEIIKSTNASGVRTRPIWTLMPHLPIYSNCRKGALPTAEWLEKRVVNLPSSVPPELVL